MTSGRTTFPISRMRAAIGRRMTESKQQTPHFYVSTEIVMDPITAAVGRLNTGRERGDHVTVTAFLVRALAETLRIHPAFNVIWAPTGPERVDEVNVAIAIALEDGLVAPALLGADRLTIDETAVRLRDLVGRARSGRLRASELTDGTFTLSNLGMHDVSTFTAIITPPQVGVLATGRIAERAVVEDGAVVIRSVLTATLSADHRVVDGIAAARFLETLNATLGNVAR